jgi:tetratricopeptide (TPR) repeat protein
LNVSEIDSSLGEYENATKESAESLRLLPGDCLSYGALAGSLLRLDRLDEAHEVMKTTEQQKAGCFHLQFLLYEFAFLRNDTQEWIARFNTRDIEGVGAVTLALAHDDTGARSLANDLARRFPQSTPVQTNYLPCVRAQLALNHRNTKEAIERLQMSVPYECGSPKGNDLLLRIYLRGQAYLMARSGSKAAAEFQKILDHRGIVLNSPTGALARLQIARAYSLQRETDKARVAYQGFLDLWKTADPDVPILRQAMAEYPQVQ